LRDARITPIYEGTTGIQASDLVGRKLGRDGGAAARAVIAQMRRCAEEAAKCGALSDAAAQLSRGIEALDEAVGHTVAVLPKDIRAAMAGAVPLLELFGIVAGGWQLLRSALIASGRLAGGASASAAGSGGGGGPPAEAAFYEAKLATARFYCDFLLPHAPALGHSIVHGAGAVLAESAL
jgi:hypothetical protein